MWGSLPPTLTFILCALSLYVSHVGCCHGDSSTFYPLSLMENEFLPPSRSQSAEVFISGRAEAAGQLRSSCLLLRHDEGLSEARAAALPQQVETGPDHRSVTAVLKHSLIIMSVKYL
ncbi:hypothetical protein XENOCAPTIV_030905 [Xenoophorus captivus]|uniref:Uncharacterized protein n=1 Tax=Xenoophorus captivus TaxID=1517983 RepID=A0ABV0QXI4_9TELE